VSAQAVRLQRAWRRRRSRSHPRNPFAFGQRRARAAGGPERTVHAAVAERPRVEAPPPLPSLTLMGIAEETPRRPAPHRRDLAASGDALFMVTEGQLVDRPLQGHEDRRRRRSSSKTSLRTPIRRIAMRAQ
jgi:hypothetical protein